MADPKHQPHPRLEATRKRLGIHRSVLAEKVGISYQHVYGIETGHNAVADETLAAIAIALGVQLEDIQEPHEPPASDAPGSAAKASRATEVRGAA